jgi:hypothetical protein
MPHESDTSHDDLFSLARQRIAEERLPVSLADEVEAIYGTGSGEECAVCEQRVERVHEAYRARSSIAFQTKRVPIKSARSS